MLDMKEQIANIVIDSGITHIFPQLGKYGSQRFERNILMAMLAALLFIVALAASLLSIFGGIAQNMPRIRAVIEHRDNNQRPARMIIAMPPRYSDYTPVIPIRQYHRPVMGLKAPSFQKAALSVPHHQMAA